jgi:hypothetical protein
MPTISEEGQALLDAAQACVDLTAVGSTAISDLATHIANLEKHIDWTVTGLEQINIDRYIQGVDGAVGDSAYILAVAGGFVGTEPQWLLSLAGIDGALNLTQLSYLQRATLRTPVSNPSDDDVIMIPSLGEFQYNPTFEFIDDDDTVFEVVDSADGVTPIGQWVMTVPAHDWSEAQKIFSNAVLWEWMEDEELRFNTY